MRSIAYNGLDLSRGGPALFASLAASFNGSAALPGVLFRHALASWVFAPQNGLRHYLKMQYADQTFRGLYHWNWFDLTLLIPYFAVMVVLSIYGIHRYTLCYLYFKHRKNYNPNPPRHFDDLPHVTVQLPIFN